MEKVPYSFGYLLQGELVQDEDTARLIAKRAWLQLQDYLWRQDERLKAATLNVPVALDQDPEILGCLQRARQQLDYLKSSEKTLEYLKNSEATENRQEDIPGYFESARKTARVGWILDQVTSDNPLTVLDVGAGWGEISVELARRGMHVTAISPFEAGTSHAKSLQESEALTIEWLHGIFETFPFKPNTFDVVVATEVIEHVRDDLSFLQKCVDAARVAVIVTTPFGAVERGFYGDFDYRLPRGQHVRSYSSGAIKFLISQLKGVDRLIDAQVVSGGQNRFGAPIQNICIRINKLPQKEKIKEPEVPHGDQEVETGGKLLHPSFRRS
jgi:hypothetical protein